MEHSRYVLRVLVRSVTTYTSSQQGRSATYQNATVLALYGDKGGMNGGTVF